MASNGTGRSVTLRVGYVTTLDGYLTTLDGYLTVGNGRRRLDTVSCSGNEMVAKTERNQNFCFIKRQSLFMMNVFRIKDAYKKL